MTSRHIALLVTVAIVLVAAVAGVLILIAFVEGTGVLLELIARSLEETP